MRVLGPRWLLAFGATFLVLWLISFPSLEPGTATHSISIVTFVLIVAILGLGVGTAFYKRESEEDSRKR